jgi:hypothetical protein
MYDAHTRILGICLLLWPVFADALPAQGHKPQQVYQYHTVVPYADAKSAIRNATCYLWIPPACSKVRAVVIASQNVLEQWLLEHPVFRKVCSKNNLAIVWACPGFFVDGTTHHPELNIPTIKRILDSLAILSGYSELQQVPWFPIGHSGTNNLVDVLVQHVPQRLVAAIKMKGEPEFKSPTVPVLCTAGGYFEWNQQNEDLVHSFDSIPKYRFVLRERAATGNLLSYFLDANTGHFDCSEQLTQAVAGFVDAACKARLPRRGTYSLVPVKLSDGWVTGLRLPGEAGSKPRRYNETNTMHHQLPWFLSRRQAKAAWKLAHADFTRKPQIAGFANEQGVPAGFTRGIVWPIPYTTGDDGITFSINPFFFKAIPDTFLHAGTPLGKGKASPAVELLCGNARHVTGNIFSIAPERNYKASATYFVIRQQGDKEYRSSVQPGSFVLKANDKGEAQTIKFEPVANLEQGHAPIPLSATSTSGMPVYFYVKSGPAEVRGNQLHVLAIPPRSAFPVRVTVVAWQWGRSGPQAVQTAPFVERIFLIYKAKA